MTVRLYRASVRGIVEKTKAGYGRSSYERRL
jgi:hypothetical protein